MWQGGGPHSSSCPSSPRHLSKFYPSRFAQQMGQLEGVIVDRHRWKLGMKREPGSE